MDVMVLTLRDLHEPPRFAIHYPHTEAAIAHFEGVCGFGPDDPITFRAIHELLGYPGMTWLLRLLPDGWEAVLRHFACDCAHDVRYHVDLGGILAANLARHWADQNIDLAAWNRAQRMARESGNEAVICCTLDDARFAAYKTARAALALEPDPLERKKLQAIQCVRLFEYARHGLAYLSPQRKHFYRPREEIPCLTRWPSRYSFSEVPEL
jgi:hypothetical protein